MKIALKHALVVSLVLFSACSMRPSAEEYAEDVAAAYGSERFDEVTLLEYTFHVQFPGREVQRRWRWEPKLDRVTFLGPDGERSYLRGDLESLTDGDELFALDARFINDQYWLLFPMHLVWDSDLTLTLDIADAPISGKRCWRLTASYGSEAGYTPGDAYDLYLADDMRIAEWVYRAGGQAEPSRITTWSDAVYLPPLTLDLDHVGPDGDFRVWFSDISIAAESTSSR